jgi:hypothetical protein
MEEKKTSFQEFNHSPSEIKKYKTASDLFSILLIDGSIIHHTALDRIAFKKWLDDNEVECLK